MFSFIWSMSRKAMANTCYLFEDVQWKFRIWFTLFCDFHLTFQLIICQQFDYPAWDFHVYRNLGLWGLFFFLSVEEEHHLVLHLFTINLSLKFKLLLGIWFPGMKTKWPSGVYSEAGWVKPKGCLVFKKCVLRF